MFVLEVIFSSAAPWVLIQDCGLMDELPQTEGIQINRVLPNQYENWKAQWSFAYVHTPTISYN